MSRAQSSVPAKSNAFNTPVPVITHTVLPSVAGEGDDMFCLRSCRLPPPSGRCQSTLPLPASTAHRCSVTASRECTSSATLRKTRPPLTIGVEPENDGIGSAQAMCSVRDHLSGRLVSALVPFPSGPRHAGQSWTAAATDAGGGPSMAVGGCGTTKAEKRERRAAARNSEGIDVWLFCPERGDEC